MSGYTPVSTHTVENQVPEMGDVNWFEGDKVLQSLTTGHGANEHRVRLSDFGAILGSSVYREHGRLANVYPPVLNTHDRFGHRIDEVAFHPSYHALMQQAKEAGMHSLPWTTKTGGHVAHTAMLYMLTQTEAGVCCPITMTYAGVPTLRHHTDWFAAWGDKVCDASYDQRHIPASEKSSLMLGMAMTEKQGGSDVRANRTQATHLSGDTYTLRGHKWFCSAPMSDGFFTLAQTSKGLTCFLVPRFLPDGTKNRLYIQRLKDKVGNRSNASSEIEYDNTWAVRIGDEGRGVPTIIEMVHHTRLDCTTAAVGLMRQSLVQAVHHAQHREVFGQKLIDQPLMRHVLMELAVEWEASMAMVFRIAESYDHADNPEEQAFSRLAVAIGKYWTNKRCIPFVGEAMECLGGAGYVEESILPRLYREAPLNGIWEGSGNVICLDVLRTIHKEPGSVTHFMQLLSGTRGLNGHYDAVFEQVHQALKTTRTMPESQWLARWLVEHLGLLLQGHQLLKSGDPIVAEQFCALRLSAQTGSRAFGASKMVDAGTVEHVLARTKG